MRVLEAYSELAGTQDLKAVGEFWPGRLRYGRFEFNFVFARVPEVPGHEPRRVPRRLIISNFAAHLVQPGLVLPVYVNPQGPEDHPRGLVKARAESARHPAGRITRP